MKLVKAGEKASEASEASEASKDGGLLHDAFELEASGSVREASYQKDLFDGVSDGNDGNDATTETYTYCEHCSEKIEWGQSEDGKWMAMQPDYTGFHKCRTKTT